MKNNKMNRYVGVAPFQLEQKDIFFGRELDSEKLYHLVVSQQQTLLYAKSGLGKSSLINAGLLPKINQNPNLKILQIRFGTYQEGRSLSPLEKILTYFPQNNAFSFLDKIIEKENSLWYVFKSWQILEPQNEFLLIFDQFEELFSYPEEQIFSFKKQMADLFYSNIPQNFRKVLQIRQKKTPDLLSEQEILLLNQKLAVKSLMSIREDRYSQMNLLVDYLPDSMHNRYALEPLDKEQARQAIIKPAQKEGNFTTEKFTYQTEALEKILSFLTKEHTQSVETTQLQILCNRLENLGLREIAEKDIPNFEDIFLEFYEQNITQFPENQQISIRRFVENELIKKGQRISLDALSCQDFVSEKTLQALVNTHLLRAERNNTGGISYELSHDTLVSPILRAKNKREEEELREEELRQAKEKAEKERQERKRQGRIIVIISIAFFISSGFAIWAFFAEQKAQNALEQAKISEQKANQNLKKILESEVIRNKGVLSQKKEDLTSFRDTILKKKAKIEIDSLKKLILDLEGKIREIR